MPRPIGLVDQPSHRRVNVDNQTKAMYAAAMVVVIVALASVLSVIAKTKSLLDSPISSAQTVSAQSSLPEPVMAVTETNLPSSPIQKGESGPCAGSTLDLETLAYIFAPARSGVDGPSTVELSSDASFTLFPTDGVSYQVFLADGTVRVSGGDPASAALLQADIEACVYKRAPTGGINTFGDKGTYGPTITQ